MTFKTPCFVRVENAEERKKLIKWLENIGRRSDVYDEDDEYIFAFAVEDENHNFTSFPNPLSGYYDCGTDVELFKALAAMNDENDREQYFVDDHGEWFKSSLDTPVAVFGSMGESGNVCFAHKATAKEIVEHFKTGNNERPSNNH